LFGWFVVADVYLFFFVTVTVLILNLCIFKFCAKSIKFETENPHEKRQRQIAKETT